VQGSKNSSPAARIFRNTHTSTLCSQTFSDILCLILVGIKLKTFDKLSFVLPSISGATENLGTNGVWLEYRNSSF
jgi:hypothetical protein